ncbi:hypothetical protein HF086_011589 [Spodoptera exigua]|uniref:Uncharacterized protein n=1 Tax=Spodoptera exigua TaxID=7107 RepID=A0A922MDC3_SPOEX|nr:hypothetical protein HF086_011589 [Spodoptera exigua]
MLTLLLSFQISFLLVCAGNVFSSPSKISKPWQYNTRKVNSSPDDTQHCFCYPGDDLPVIHKLLDPKNKGQERLVIYLYRSVDSNEIKMFTPNSDKQMLIPDIPYDSNDVLVTVTNENIDTLFYNNPNKIKVHNDYLETVNPTVVSSLPIGLNQGEIEHIFPGYTDDISLNDKESSNEYDNDDYVVPPYKSYDNANLAQVEAQTVPLKSFPENDFETNQNWALPNTNLDGFEETLQGVLPSSSAFLLPPEDNIQQKLVYSFQNNDNTATSQDHLSFDAWFKQQMKRFQNPHFPSDLKSIDSDLLKVLVIKIFSKNKINISSNGVITGRNGETIDTANLELRPLLLGEKISLQIFNTNHKKINLLKRLPFMEGILVTLVSPPQILGIIPLGKIYLTKNSNYIDQIINQLSALNSSKVYTSKHTDATFYLNPSQSTINNILSEPENIRVESISSFTSDQDGGRKGKWETDIKAQAIPLPDERTQWNSGLYYSAPNVPYPNWHPLVEIQPSGKRRKFNAKIEHIFEPPTKTRNNAVEGTQTALKEANIKVTSTTKPPVDSSKPKKKLSEPLLKGMLKTLMDLLNDTPRRDQSKSNTTHNFDIISDSELTKYEEDGPDFRIIGGSAATGSGTPVSSKGRSGIREEFSS